MGTEYKTIVTQREDAVFYMDRDGIWHNEHGRFEHPRIISYFNRSIQKDDQGYFLTQMIGEHRREKVYFPYQDTAVFVVDIRPGDPIRLVLNTETRIPLEPEHLFTKSDSLFMDTPDHLIKFSQQALSKISRYLDEDDRGLVLTMGSTSYPVPER